jgi:hypothetical protein
MELFERRSTCRTGKVTALARGAVAVLVFCAAAGVPDAHAQPRNLRPDPAPGQPYTMRMLVRGYWANGGGSLDGASGQAESTDLISGHDADDAGNLYWTECDSPIIRSYRPATGRIVTVAGSVRGSNDGPMTRARFGGWSYNSTSLLSVSGDGKHLFVLDRRQGRRSVGQWRYVNLEAGTVTTVAPLQLSGKDQAHLIIAKDASGQIYAFCTNGSEPPDCKGYQKLSVAAVKDMLGRHLPFDRYSLDTGTMHFYWHCRGPIMMTNLKTGAVEMLTTKGGDGNGPGGRAINTSGPLHTTSMLCPTGMSISPGGGYLYVGQGDGSSCFRMDLEKKHTLVFGALEDGGFGWRETGASWQGPKNSCAMTGSTGWPAATVLIPAGRGYWNTCWGIYSLTPLEGKK